MPVFISILRPHTLDLHPPCLPTVARSFLYPRHDSRLTEPDQPSQLHIWNKPLVCPLIDRRGTNTQKFSHFMWSEELVHLATGSPDRRQVEAPSALSWPVFR